MTSRSMTIAEVELEQRSFIVRVYSWMAFALAVTAITAMLTVATPAIIRIIVGNRLLFLGLVISELLLVGYLSATVQRLSAAAATAIFLGYAVLNGLTLSLIFLVFTTESIASTFFVTAGTFALLSFYGYVTKQDLTSLGNLCLTGLIGMILASLVNLFFHNNAIYWVTTYIGILVFVGLIAYDTQKIKDLNVLGNAGTEADQKEAIMGALMLYLDFINLFLLLLRIFGRRK